MNRTAAEVIREARNVLFERGWTQRQLEDPDGSVCLVGAVRVARWKGTFSPLCLPDSQRQMPSGTRAALAAAIGVRANGVESWNDDPERTFSDIIDVLDRAEKIAEERAV